MKVAKCKSQLLWIFILVSILVITSCATETRINYNVPKGIDLTDIIRGDTDKLAQLSVYSELRMPSSIKGKIPAVVIMHGSGGVRDFREIEMAKLLNKRGIAAIIPYSFKSRGVVDVRQTAGSGVTYGMRMVDAYTALNLLSAHPNIDKDRIGIIGYSSGSIISLLSQDEKIRKKLAKNNLKFAAHVGVMPCAQYGFKNPEPTDAPLLFLAGEKDDWCPVEKVISYAQRLKDAGGNVQTMVYPEAHHGFDTTLAMRRISLKYNIMCEWEILNDGRFHNITNGSLIPEGEFPGNNFQGCKPQAKFTIAGNSFAASQFKTDAINFFVNALKPDQPR